MRTLLLVLASFVALAGRPASADRFISKLALPSGQTAVVAEGEFEARSVGSFSIRLYQAAPAPDATTFFTAGLIRPRDGSVESVRLEDIDGAAPGQPEVVVILRSVGTGSYVSAQAFSYDDDRIRLVAMVAGLPPRADPVAALRGAVMNR